MSKPEKIKIKVLAEYVKEFLELACPQMSIVYTRDDELEEGQVDEDGDIIPNFLSVEETLATWVQLPDCSYTPMFIGWLLARGITLEQFTPADVDKAVCAALTGSEKSNVMFDYLGDIDATQKPN